MAVSKKELTKKKKWYQIRSDELFNSMYLGESLVEKPEEMIGKRVMLNLMTLTGDSKKQNTWVKFVVDAVTDQKGIAHITGYAISPSSIRRLVRRGRDRIDHSFLVFTKDAVPLRLKFLLITRSNITHATLAALRKRSLQFLHHYASTHTYNELVTEIIQSKLQDALRAVLNKIYPLRNTEIRAFTIDKKAKAPRQAEVKMPSQPVVPVVQSPQEIAVANAQETPAAVVGPAHVPTDVVAQPPESPMVSVSAETADKKPRKKKEESPVAPAAP